MSTNYIDEYLLKLGATVDASGMQRFNQALREASLAADASAVGIAGAFFKAQTEIVGGFVAIGTAALGLVDKVAMADQQYRLFALHMYMGKENARGLKVAMDALGASLEDITWDKELRERTHQLLMDQRAMAPDGDFDGQMRKIRDIRFEFTRMEVEGQYLAMHAVEGFMKALGFGPDELLKKLRSFNDWVTHDMPQISDKLVAIFMPVWQDLKIVAASTEEALKAVGLAFTNVVGAITGDTSIEGGAFNLEKFGKAAQYTAHWFAEVAVAINAVLEALAALTAELGYLVSNPKIRIGVGLATMDPGLIWSGIKGEQGKTNGDAAAADTDKSTPGREAYAAATTSVHSLIDKYAVSIGVDPALAHAVAMHESGERQFDKNGSPLRNPGSSATGVYQLVKGTANFMGVDSSNTEQNISGGVGLLRQLLARYHGNVAEAVGAYGEGAGVMDSVLAGKATLRPEAMSNIAGVMRMMGKHGDVQVGAVTIHITQQPGESNADLARRVKTEFRASQDKKVQRNLAEFQDLAWSY